MTQSPIASWRTQNTLYKLEGSFCPSCLTYALPAPGICSCGNTTLTPYQFSGNGTLISFTQVTSATSDFHHQTPFCIGLIELEHSIRTVGQLVDTTLQDLYLNMPVIGVFRKLYDHPHGIIQYGIKFKPHAP